MPDPVADPTPSTPAASGTPAPTPAVTPPATPPVAAAPPAPAAAPPADPNAKPPEAKPPEAKPPEPAKPVVPEKYDYSALKLPEGITLDTPLLAAVEPIFKELGLTQEGASKLVEAHAKALASAEVQREADFKTWMASQVAQNQAALKKEWGLAYEANLVISQKGMARYCSPAMKALLDETGLGNHPEFVKAFLQIGKSVTEDTPPPGGVPPSTKRDAASVLYGGSASTN